MTLQEAIEFLEDLQPNVCENCTMQETCDNAGTGICVEALNILKAEALRSADLQASIDSGELVEVVHGKNVAYECEQQGRWGKCSLCHKVMRVEYRFCPCCGAKMKTNN